MRKINYFASLALLLLVLSFLTSCNKDKEVKPAYQKDSESAKSTLEVIAEIESINTMVLSFSTQGDPGGRRAAIKEVECGLLTNDVDNATGIQTTTVDYGTGQTCTDGSVRKGKIIFTTTLSADTSEISMDAQFVNYETNGKKLDGQYTVNATHNESQQTFTYVFNFKDAVLTYADNSQVRWNSTYTMTMQFVMGTGDMLAFSLLMNGGLSGTNRQGKAFSADLTSPLVIDASCQFGITSGKYLIKAEGYADAVYDFGNGECDNFATLTINGQSERITLER